MNWFRNVLGRKPDPAPAAPSSSGSPSEPPRASEDRDASLFGQTEWLEAEADSHMAQGKPADALVAMNVAIAALNAALKDRTDLPARERWLGTLHDKLCSIKVKLRDLDGAAQAFLASWATLRALKFIQDASAIFAGLAKEWNGEPKHRQYFAACTELLAECFTALGKPELAAELKRQAGG
jgi:hypothetical protein